jgi:predicted small metal-binding protein
MNSAEGPSHWSFSCRDVGYSCEWRLRAANADEIQTRFKEHARCAHQIREVPPELLQRVVSASRSG